MQTVKVDIELEALMDRAVERMCADSGLPEFVVRGMVNMEAMRGGRASIILLIGKPAREAK
jgi:hypothetical protein